MQGNLKRRVAIQVASRMVNSLYYSAVINQDQASMLFDRLVNMLDEDGNEDLLSELVTNKGGNTNVS